MLPTLPSSLVPFRPRRKVVVLGDTRRIQTTKSGERDILDSIMSATAVTLGSVGELGDLEAFVAHTAEWEGPKVAVGFGRRLNCLRTPTAPVKLFFLLVAQASYEAKIVLSQYIRYKRPR